MLYAIVMRTVCTVLLTVVSNNYTLMYICVIHFQLHLAYFGFWFILVPIPSTQMFKF